MIFAFKGMTPVVDSTSFVHPQATLIGHVTIGPDCYGAPTLCCVEIGGKLCSNVAAMCRRDVFPHVSLVRQSFSWKVRMWDMAQ